MADNDQENINNLINAQNLLTKISDLRKENVKDLTEENNILQKIATLEEDVRKKQELQQEIKQNSLKIEEDTLNTLGKVVKESATKLKSNEDFLALAKQQQAFNEEELKNTEDLVEKEKESLETALNAVKIQEQKIGKINEELNALEKVESAKTSIDEASQSMLRILGLNTQAFSNSFLGKMASAKREGLGYSEQLKIIAKNTFDALRPTNLFSQSLQSVTAFTLELVREQENALGSFNKSTGAAGKYNDLIRDVGHSNLSLGVDTGMAAEATQALFEEFSSFTSLNKETQAELIATTSALTNAGVSAGTSAKIMETLTKNFGMSAKQAVETEKRIVEMGNAIGVSTKKVSEDFANVMPKLSDYGKDATKIFEQLEKMSKQTGLSVDSLEQFSRGFDTISGAGEKISKLNAILGPQFDFMAVMMAAPQDRIKMLQQGIEKTAGSIENMSRRQLQMLSSALGLTTDEFTKLLGPQKLASDQEKKWDEIVQKSLTIWQALKGVVMNFAISLGPVIDWFKKIIITILAWTEKHPILTKAIGITALAIGGLFTVLSILAPAMITTSIAFGGFTASATAASPAVVSLGTSMAAAAPGLLSFGAAVLMIGGAIALVIGSIALLAYNFSIFFKSLSNITGSTVKSLYGVAGAISAISLALLTLSPLSALGFTIMMKSVASDAAEIATAKSGMDSFKEVIQVANKIETTSIENVKQLVEQAKEYKEIQSTMMAPAMDTFVQALKSAIGGGGNKQMSTPAGGGGETTVVLKLDGRALDTHILNVIENKIRIK
jgi:hypothetical protein